MSHAGVEKGEILCRAILRCVKAFVVMLLMEGLVGLSLKIFDMTLKTKICRISEVI